MVKGVRVKNTEAKKSPPRKPGRPTDYSQELAEEICWLVTLGKTVEQIGRMAKMPAERTIYQWLAKHQEFAQDYTQARENRRVRRQDRLTVLSADVLKGKLNHKAFTAVANQENWQSEREAPKKYGKYINLNHGGNIGVGFLGRVRAAKKEKTDDVDV